MSFLCFFDVSCLCIFYVSDKHISLVAQFKNCQLTINKSKLKLKVPFLDTTMKYLLICILVVFIMEAAGKTLLKPKTFQSKNKSVPTYSTFNWL